MRPRHFLLLLLAAALLPLTGCETTTGGVSPSIAAAIANEAPGNYYIGRRYYKKDYKMWGWVRKPGQPWKSSQLIMMNENTKLAPDRAGGTLGTDNNYEYRLEGYFTGGQVYEPASNTFYPEFVLTGYNVISTAARSIRRSDCSPRRSEANRPMRPRNFVALLAFGVAALTASCGKSGPDPVVIGLNLELTGDIQTIGQSAKNAAELFFAKQNEAGGIELAEGKRPVKLVAADNAANATQAASIAQQQISRENIIAMIGPNSGKCATTASEIAEALKCVMISPWSPDPMTTMDPVAGVPKRYVFRAGATDELQGQIMAEFAAKKLGARRAAIISDSAQGAAQAAGFKQAFTAAGGEVVDEKVFEAVGKDFPLQVGSIASSSPEVVFVAASCEDTLDILEAAKAAGLNAKFLGTELWNSPQTIRMTALGIDGLYFCRNFDHRDADPQTVKFVEEYTAKYNTPPDDVAALTYDACGLLAAALQKSGKNEREALRESLARTSSFEGVAGTYNFEPGSGDPVKSMPVLQIKSSGLEWIGDFGK